MSLVTAALRGVSAIGAKTALCVARREVRRFATEHPIGQRIAARLAEDPDALRDRPAETVIESILDALEDR